MDSNGTHYEKHLKSYTKNNIMIRFDSDSIQPYQLKKYVLGLHEMTHFQTGRWTVRFVQEFKCV